LIRILIAVIIFLNTLFASHLEVKKWKGGQNYTAFLKENNLPLSLFFNLDDAEKKLVADIGSGVRYFVLKDEDNNNTIKQILVPIGEELQIHIYNEGEGNYTSKLIPILYQIQDRKLALSINTSPYNDIINLTHNLHLAGAFLEVFRGMVNFRRLKRGDKLLIHYKEKARLGSKFNYPAILSASLEVNKKPHYQFRFNNRFYDEKGREPLKRFYLATPCRYRRISDRFTYKRWHPILKRYRAHLGIDYAARTGTPVKAAAGGKVVQKGWRGGYGRCITINHLNGYKTLYAHLSRYKKGLKVGKRVKRGQVIGYIGSSGLSTGPHLHFGLYKNNRAINPAGVLRLKSQKLKGKKLKEFKSVVKKELKILNDSIKDINRYKEYDNADFILSCSLDKHSCIK
jgi:murein DD-endopeptidase MepM/ murein hydrolase activator NlpD